MQLEHIKDTIIWQEKANDIEIIKNTCGLMMLMCCCYKNSNLMPAFKCTQFYTKYSLCHRKNGMKLKEWRKKKVKSLLLGKKKVGLI